MEDSLVKVAGQVLDYLSGLDVEWYDLSDNSNRNANGDMRLNIVNNKYKLILKTRYLNQTELQDFFSKIPVGELSVEYFNPYTGTSRTANMYRGDRKVSLYWDLTDKGKLYNPIEISLIEL